MSTFIAQTTLGPMQVTTHFWQEQPHDNYRGARDAKFQLTYRFGTVWGSDIPDTAPITINRIEYSGDITIEYYRPSNCDDFHRGGGVSSRLTRADGGEPTANAQSAIYRAIHDDAKSRNLLPLIETAKHDNAQKQADREIEKAREHLKRAQEWSRFMAPADARHYAAGFTVTASYDEAADN